MKHLSHNPLILVAIGMAMFILQGCATTNIRHVSSEEFVSLLKPEESANSGGWRTYVGVSSSRAYIEGQSVWFRNGNDPYTIVYWTELKGLPDDVAELLRNSRPRQEPDQNKK